ncbi:P-loop containing nucleoside triphosphate hydrolase protein [Hymenopellis radicata]|nr:P-loop containing nucleoside triphosphate hydrolase protein [Hymenopellis radicata]
MIHVPKRVSRLVFARLVPRRWQSTSIVLRPYQEQCLVSCTDALRDGLTRIGVSLPTGSGKTTVFISLLAKLAKPAPHAKRALIIVNSIELARQSAEQVERLFPEWSVEIEQGVKHKASGSADVTVATYQTLLQQERIAKFEPDKMKAIIVDEAHHAAAPSYRRILSYFDSEIRHPDHDDEAFASVEPITKHKIPIIGFSATFSRHDGLALGSVFQHIVYHRDFLEMIKEQWLCNVRFTSVTANIDLKNVTVSSATGDFNPTSLAQVINTETLNKLVVQTWLDHASERKSTLVFCVNIAHVEALTHMFRQSGIDARYLYSKTPALERRALVSAFKAGQFPVLINCAILTEGADIPNIDCVILARPTRSKNVFAQMIGRGMRLSPATGKSDCRIIDFVDSNNRVAGVMSTPTLFGLDPSEIGSIIDESLEDMEERAKEAASRLDSEDNVPAPKTVTYIDYDDPLSFLKMTEAAAEHPHISKLSKHTWIAIGEEKYILECLNKGHISVEFVPEGTFHGHRATAFALKVSPFMRSRKVLTALHLDEAIRGCDTYALNKVVHGPMALGLLRSAKWRHAPASDSQKAFITKRWKVDSELGDSVTVRKAERIAKLTKGEAANIISGLKHGAMAYHQKKAKAAAKSKQLQSKEKERRSRVNVSVGPLHAN